MESANRSSAFGAPGVECPCRFDLGITAEGGRPNCCSKSPWKWLGFSSPQRVATSDTLRGSSDDLRDECPGPKGVGEIEEPDGITEWRRVEQRGGRL